MYPLMNKLHAIKVVYPQPLLCNEIFHSVYKKRRWNRER